MKIQTPASHKHDPETSFIAEAKMNQGKRYTHQSLILKFVVDHPGHTAGEIGEYTSLGQHESSRRLSELNGVYVEKGVRKACYFKKTQMVTWWPMRVA